MQTQVGAHLRLQIYKCAEEITTSLVLSTDTVNLLRSPALGSISWVTEQESSIINSKICRVVSAWFRACDQPLDVVERNHSGVFPSRGCEMLVMRILTYSLMTIVLYCILRKHWSWGQLHCLWMKTRVQQTS